jgi:hypothetical protein
MNNKKTNPTGHHFSRTPEWHCHAARCLGGDNVVLEPTFSRVEATQLTFGDSDGPWVQ